MVDIGTAVLGLVALVAAGSILKGSGFPQGNRRDAFRVTRRRLLTENETEFFFRLRAAIGDDFHVMAQVSMGALMNAGGGGSRARFDRKIVDYVICDRSLKVVLLVELDDRTHDKQKDRARDRMTAEAGYQTLRIESKNKPGVAELRKLVLAALR